MIALHYIYIYIVIYQDGFWQLRQQVSIHTLAVIGRGCLAGGAGAESSDSRYRSVHGFEMECFTWIGNRRRKIEAQSSGWESSCRWYRSWLFYQQRYQKSHGWKISTPPPERGESWCRRIKIWQNGCVGATGCLYSMGCYFKKES